MLEIRDSIKEIRRDLAVALLGSAVLIYGAAVGIYYCERHIQPEAFGSVPAALWWAVITLTTIGYGDVYPVTPLGKVLTTLVALLGLGMVAIPTGLLAAAADEEHHKDRLANRNQLPLVARRESLSPCLAPRTRRRLASVFRTISGGLRRLRLRRDG